MRDACPPGITTAEWGDEWDRVLPSESIAVTWRDYVRGLRLGRTQQPDESKAWELGGVLSRLSGKRWINPVTMLFACGHYGAVADLFLRLNYGRILRPQLREMARTLETVARSSEISRQPTITDDISIRVAKKWDQLLPPSERYDRRVWSLDMATYGAFTQAWRAQRASGCVASAVVAACQTIAEHALYDVDSREHHVILLLLDGLEAG